MFIKILRVYLMGMGVIFTVLLLLLSYLVIVDPFHMRPLLQLVLSARITTDDQSGMTTTSTTTTADGSGTAIPTTAVTQKSATNGPTAAQTQALKAAGINPSTLNGGFTATQVQCFEQILGQTRVQEIKNGAVPTASEFFAVRGCL